MQAKTKKNTKNEKTKQKTMKNSATSHRVLI